MTMMKIFAGMITGPDGQLQPTFTHEHPFFVVGNRRGYRPTEYRRCEDGRMRHVPVPPPNDSLKLFHKRSVPTKKNPKPQVFHTITGNIADLIAKPVSRQTRRARERFEAKFAVIA